MPTNYVAKGLYSGLRWSCYASVPTITANAVVVGKDSIYTYMYASDGLSWSLSNSCKQTSKMK